MLEIYADLVGEIEPFEGLEDLLANWRRGLAPPPDLRVSQWADQSRILDKPFTKNRMRWRTDYVPYTREIMDCLSPSSPVKRVSWLKSAQVAGSETGNNWLGFTIAHNPGLLMLVNPTKNMVKRMSRRIQSLIDSSDGLSELVKPARSRDSNNTREIKQFPGGMILFVGANSGADLRSYACPLLFFDEVDGMPFDVDNEGHPVAVAEARTFGQGEEYKIYLNSTPKIEQTSQIWREWLRGDQRYYMMRCPNSGLLVHWEVKNLHLEEPGRLDSVRYRCTCGCGGAHIEGLHKTRMLAEGLWVPKIIRTQEDLLKRLNDGDDYELRQFNQASLERSYWTPAAYSPIGMMSWRRIMEQWQEAQGVYSLLKAFRNTVEGLPWKEIGDAPDAEVIWNRRSRVYRMRQVPEEVVMLTAGADVGQDHIEVSVYGWGRRQQRWLIEHIRINGPYNDKSTWDRLDDVLERRYEHASGAIMAIRRLCIDRGKWTDTVDGWVNSKNERRVTAVKGYDHLEAPFKWSGTKKQHTDGTQSQRQFSIKWALAGVSYLKLELLGNLNLPREDQDTVPAGWLHLPEDVPLDWIKQLTAEKRVYTKNKKTGVMKASWERTTERAEALDCTNYARTAAAIEGWDDWSDNEFSREEDHLHQAAEERRVRLYEWQQRNGGTGTIDDAVPGLVRPMEAPDFSNAEQGVMTLNLPEPAPVPPKPAAPAADIGIVGCKAPIKNIPMPDFGSGGYDDDE